MSSTASQSVPTRCVVAASVLAIGFAVVAAAIALRPIGAAAGAPSTTTVGPSASTSSIVTTQPLLRGSPAPGANQTTTTVGGTTGPDNSNKTTHSTNYKVWGIVAALIAVAVIIAILTWVYWRRTRPDMNPSQGSRSQSGGQSDPPGSAQPTETAAASRGDGTPTEPAARRSTATEEQAEGERRPGEEFAEERGLAEDVADESGLAEDVVGESGLAEDVADEPGWGGLVGRLRSNRSRYADIVITVPHPDDLRHDPS